MYDHFLRTNIISVHSRHIMDSGLFEDFKRRMQQTTDEIYSDLEKNKSLLPDNQESRIPWNV